MSYLDVSPFRGGIFLEVYIQNSADCCPGYYKLTQACTDILHY